MTDVTQFLENGKFNIIGITGNAGAGKTNLLNSLNDISFVKYSIDWRFIGDSSFRKQLLKNKSNSSLQSYIDACNQFNWWDWDQIAKDLTNLQLNNFINFTAYDRDIGTYKEVSVVREQRKSVVEGALLGPASILQEFDIIIFVYTSSKVRLNRILSKDSGRRNINEILARFLITEYSEYIYYKHLFSNYAEKILFVDNLGNFIKFPEEEINSDCFIPLPI